MFSTRAGGRFLCLQRLLQRIRARLFGDATRSPFVLLFLLLGVFWPPRSPFEVRTLTAVVVAVAALAAVAVVAVTVAVGTKLRARGTTCDSAASHSCFSSMVSARRSITSIATSPSAAPPLSLLLLLLGITSWNLSCSSGTAAVASPLLLEGRGSLQPLAWPLAGIAAPPPRRRNNAAAALLLVVVVAEMLERSMESDM